jgi:putative tryptophan/tyrosine transport system substrate-binding protein
MRRRQFIAGLGSTAAWPVVARAQQPARPVVGLFRAGSIDTATRNDSAFSAGLGETGYVEG